MFVRRVLPQFEGRHAEYSLQGNRPDRTGIHPRSLEHWCKFMRGGERHGGGVRLRHIEEHLTTFWADQCRKHRFGRVAVICMGQFYGPCGTAE